MKTPESSRFPACLRVFRRPPAPALILSKGTHLLKSPNRVLFCCYMRRFVLTAILTIGFSQCLLFQARAFIDVNLQMQLGNPSGAITDTNNHNHYLIQRTVEAIDYSD